MKSIESCLHWAKQTLAGGESPALDARVLLCHCLDVSATYLMTWPDKPITQKQWDQYQALIQKRKLGHPVAHLIGHRDFWTLNLEVTPDTLIPRPETELLVEQALALELPAHAHVLDLGTGTGAIALALASERPDLHIIGVDFNENAVALAKRNGVSNHLPQVQFLHSNWFERVPTQKFDLIISNPPYVESDSPWLNEGDVRFEPLSALTSGEDGLDDIRHIVTCSLSYLTDTGIVMFEHGYQQGQAVRSIFTSSEYRDAQTICDMNDLARVTFAFKSH
ncbi:peptide chain release factor N(5)-glutamine methyltransferase [Aestuariibacter sp. AA17]|uniref:Release factor glutamine methyltransferase n=1 Tax=Fluctibacter corallii TaxID=2984329 RepID=A0ABT3ADD1_9ALTE|nr:peptide chain release factor N(5)-glutamine methyltransferase [Aestuariibacter sp. AA17]MCV2886664.1 peptide chain release factor N(5)-glutamine methyltransferase [Aestuariibacter sp. AA17]